jgi:hypothetical protein
VIERPGYLKWTKMSKCPRVSLLHYCLRLFSHSEYLQDKVAELAEEWICMTSPDGFTFLVKGKVAVVSGTLKNSLTSGFRSCHNCTPDSSETKAECLGGLGESQTKLIDMTERSAVTHPAASMTHATARGAVVDKLVEYLAHKSIYEKKARQTFPTLPNESHQRSLWNCKLLRFARPQRQITLSFLDLWRRIITKVIYPPILKMRMTEVLTRPSV